MEEKLVGVLNGDSQLKGELNYSIVEYGGKEILITDKEENLPSIGNENILYAVKNTMSMYVFDTGVYEYSKVGKNYDNDLQDYITREIFENEIKNIVQDRNLIYIQSVASATWNIIHNLNKMPSVTIVDSAGNVVIGEIKYIDTNELTVAFSGAFSGKAFLN